MTEEIAERIQAVAWKTLFGEDLERYPDPNKPENVPYLKAKQKQKVDQFKNFAEGTGKPLFEQWQSEIRTGMFTLLIKEDMLTDEAIRLLDQLRYLVKMVSMAQSIIDETND